MEFCTYFEFCTLLRGGWGVQNPSLGQTQWIQWNIYCWDSSEINTSYNECEGDIFVHRDIIFAAFSGCLVLFMLSYTSLDTRDSIFAHNTLQFYAVKSRRNVFIISSGWLSFLCCQELKKCICYLLRIAVIFMVPRAEEMYLLFAQDGCHFYAAKSWRNVIY